MAVEMLDKHEDNILDKKVAHSDTKVSLINSVQEVLFTESE
jgi:hypothetical protein